MAGPLTRLYLCPLTLLPRPGKSVFPVVGSNRPDRRLLWTDVTPFDLDRLRPDRLGLDTRSFTLRWPPGLYAGLLPFLTDKTSASDFRTLTP